MYDLGGFRLVVYSSEYTVLNETQETNSYSVQHIFKRVTCSCWISGLQSFVLTTDTYNDKSAAPNHLRNNCTPVGIAIACLTNKFAFCYTENEVPGVYSTYN